MATPDFLISRELLWYNKTPPGFSFDDLSTAKELHSGIYKFASSDEKEEVKISFR